MIGAMLGMAGLSAISGLASSGLNQYFTERNMANQQAYNSAEAEKARQFASNQATAANEFSATQAQLNRDWQERMSNTAIQRQMADLKAAGLNPALAVSGGGATVGSGASASGVSVAGHSASASAPGGAGVNLGIDGVINSALKLEQYRKFMNKSQAEDPYVTSRSGYYAYANNYKNANGRDPDEIYYKRYLPGRVSEPASATRAMAIRSSFIAKRR